jgi:hypothetical protein
MASSEWKIPFLVLVTSNKIQETRQTHSFLFSWGNNCRTRKKIFYREPFYLMFFLKKPQLLLHTTSQQYRFKKSNNWSKVTQLTKMGLSVRRNWWIDPDSVCMYAPGHIKYSLETLNNQESTKQWDYNPNHINKKKLGAKIVKESIPWSW